MRFTIMYFTHEIPFQPIIHVWQNILCHVIDFPFTWHWNIPTIYLHVAWNFFKIFFLAHLGKLSYSLFIIHCSPTSIIASIGIQFEYIEDKSITHVGISMYMQTNIVHVSVFVEIQTKSKLLHEPRA
jgi:hypothetical protein